jgi:MFS family permease
MPESQNSSRQDPTLKTSGPSRRRIAIAAMSGTLIELYDFVIYGTAAALVFPKTFFPALGPTAGTVASFATLGVAFILRPLGSVVFGHFGDRLGRKKTLVASLLLMGFATIGVGLLPSAATIGVLAPILLIVLRGLQGLAAGGEWAGAALLVSENAPPGKRGAWTMFPQLGGTVAISLANLTFLIVSLGMSDESFVSWGWRLPFISSILLVAVGLWIRLGIDETPVFKEDQARNGSAKVPFVEAFKHQGGRIFLAAGLGITAFSLQYLSNTYLVSYAANTIDLGRTFVLTIGVFSGIVLSIAVVTSALLSDRIGRKLTIGVANIAGAFWAVLMFLVLEQETRVAYAIAVLVAMFIAGAAFGPMAAILTELFHTRYRYTAAGLSYNLTSIVGGGIVPLIAAPITAAYGVMVFAWCLAGLSVVAAICTFAVPETSKTSLRDPETVSV